MATIEGIDCAPLNTSGNISSLSFSATVYWVEEFKKKADPAAAKATDGEWKVKLTLTPSGGSPMTPLWEVIPNPNEAPGEALFNAVAVPANGTYGFAAQFYEDDVAQGTPFETSKVVEAEV